MSESGDYTPRIWKDHDFGSARAHYDRHVGRSYADAKVAGKKTTDVLPKNITTQSSAPLIVICDETGSMGNWPKVIFSKLPYLYNEARDEYLGPDVEISFGAFGDATCGESYPVQARPFAAKDEVKKRLEELVIEGGGGGQMTESSELAALYYARNVEIPNALQKPILILITDEYCYTNVSVEMAKHAGVKLQGRISTDKIFEELKEKYAVYLILKPYHNSSRDDDSMNREVREHWLKYVDLDHIATLGEPDRVVDVIFGILAKETGKIAYFKKELEDRQLKDDGGAEKVEIAYKALRTIHAVASANPPKQLRSGHSTMFHTKGGKKAKDLI